VRGIRAAARYARAFAFHWSGAHRRTCARLDGTRAAVLMYHRVLPAADAARNAVESGMFVTPETFERHLEWLTADFRVLPLHEITSRLADRADLPPGACAITFDDGWRDNHDFALPALAKRGIPATVFVVTERVGTEGAFWPDEVCGRLAGLSGSAQRALLDSLGIGVRGDPVDAMIAYLKGLTQEAREPVLERIRSTTSDPSAGHRALMNWEELDRLARAGIDIEAHGATHAILTLAAPDDVERELRSARAGLRERGHGRHDLLAYPSGAHDDRVKSLARSAGYAAAFTTDLGLATATHDPLALPRVGMHDDVSRTRVEFLHRIPAIS
jgi:peptidoglycan/xylan/chitin deacetylase (PgdA/CDA1 family)